MKLSRRDRAEMVLALEVLREVGPIGPFGLSEAESSLRGAWDVLSMRRYRGSAAWAAAPDLVLCTYGRGPSRYRVLRASLALALRVLLRADAGDDGPWLLMFRCTWCRREQRGSSTLVCGYDLTPRGECSGEMRVVRDRRAPIRPLWLDAPPHEASR